MSLHYSRKANKHLRKRLTSIGVLSRFLSVRTQIQNSRGTKDALSTEEKTRYDAKVLNYAQAKTTFME